MNSRAFLTTLVILISFLPMLHAHSAPLFVKERPVGETIDSLSFRISRPRPDRGTSLSKGLQIKGCWVQQGYRTFRASDAKGKKIRFKKTIDGSALEFRKVRTIKYPISAKVTFETPLPVARRASSVTALGQTKCETRRNKKGKVTTDCSTSQPIEARSAFSGVTCAVPSDFTENLSDGTIVFADGDEFTIRNLSSPLRFAFQGTAFSEDLTNATVVVNDESYLAPDLFLDSGLLTTNAPLIDGQNFVTVVAEDINGFQAVQSFTFWAGSNSLEVIVVDPEGIAAADGTARLSIADAPQFSVSLPLVSGRATFTSLPGTTIAVSALTSDGKAGFGAGAGNQGFLSITALPLLNESPIANNDLSQGAQGWAAPSSSVITVIPHTEDEPAVLPAQVGTFAMPNELPDNDIVLRTSGEGPRFMTRTFRTDPRTRLVRIRYRFQTSEYPGGYFGSRFNDFYNVSLRSSKGASILDDGSSMNALGRAAFSPAGFTTWRSTVIPVNRSSPPPSEGEVVQAQVVVANVADGAFDSRVIVDKIEESPFAITERELFDIDNTPLTYVSVDSHQYFDGFTHIHGRITVEGEADDGIESMRLKFMDGATEAGFADLSTQASNKLIGKKFGKTGKISIPNPMLLFKIFPNELTRLTTEEDKGYSLIVEARSKKGLVSQSTVKTVQALVQYKGTNRYDGRDANYGGDDWVLPHIRQLLSDFPSVTWGDFSNMNGGVFNPHDRHREGRSIDGWIPGYNELNETTAESLIALLNGPSGNRIRFLYVRYNRSPQNRFYRAIAGRTLNNGRPVERVILPDGQHGTHFHAEF